MGIRSPNSQSLRNACREVAENNWGFVKTNEKSVQQKINGIYAESDNLAFTDASEVTEENIETILNNLVERGEAKKCGKGVYFIDPFSRQKFNPENIIENLENVFRNSPFVTEEKLKKKLENPQISISSEEKAHLISELENRGYITEGFAGAMQHSYYKPGESLTGHHLADLPPLSDELADAASNGVVTRGKLQSVLGLNVDDRIISELQSKDAIRDLGQENNGPYLIYNQSCMEDHVEAKIDRDMLTKIENIFENSNYILEQPEFENKLLDLLDQRTNILSVVAGSERKIIHEHLQTVVKRQCSYSIEKKTLDNGINTEVVICVEEIDTLVDREARERIKKEADGVPAADKPFLENEVFPAIRERSYGHNAQEEIKTYIQNNIVEQADEIAKNESLREVITGG
jgi:chromosome segregation and condensation protein ScpB